MDAPFSIFLKLLILLGADVVFVGLLLLAISPLLLARRAALAVLLRNFVGYFTNPTGYVFLCLFVLITSFAAFWPDEFFNSNLANLAQLNRYLPYIMLIYIPAITMSVWAEERRQGTDELLLTIPATDFDIVLGKYLAASSIFTASLLFSQICNFLVLLSLSLGEIDVGLFFANYTGYWLIGLAMLAVGMIASFLTSNLTVSFILGALFNAPLAFAGAVHALIPSHSLADAITRWSYSGQFEGFGRGVIDAAAVSFYLMVAAIGLYVCMVLIGRRHWLAGQRGMEKVGLGLLALVVALVWVGWTLASPTALGRVVHIIFAAVLTAMLGGLAFLSLQPERANRTDHDFMLGHYLARGLSLALLAAGANLLFTNFSLLRIDATRQKIATLSGDTVSLIHNLDAKHPVTIDAYLSREVPDQWARSKLEFLSVLKEFERRGEKITVRLHDNLTPFSDETQQARDQYGIKPNDRSTHSRGVYRQDKIIFGVAFTSGLKRVVIPFFESGVPVEYTLARALRAVTEPEKKRLAVIITDAKLFDDIISNPMAMRQDRVDKKPIITELETRYTVEQVSADKAIDVTGFDAMLLVQPSTLSPPQLENVLDAIRAGLPVAIFEDPLPTPYFGPGAPAGTGQAKQPTNPFAGRQGPSEKCDIKRLFDLVGVQLEGRLPNRGGLEDPFQYKLLGWQANVVWQEYNPYPNLRMFNKATQFVFASANATPEAFSSTHPITNGLREVLFITPGALQPKGETRLKITPLVRTSLSSNLVKPDEVGRAEKRAYAKQGFNLAVAIEGDAVPLSAAEKKKRKDKADLKSKTDKDQAAKDDDHDKDHDKDNSAEGKKSESGNSRQHTEDHIKAVFVADVDLFAPIFVGMRNQKEAEVDFQFDNVPFMLNLVDYVAGNEDLLELCKRRARFASLRMIDEKNRQAREEVQKEEEKFMDRFNVQQGIIDEMERIGSELQRDDDQALVGRSQQLQIRTALLNLVTLVLPKDNKHQVVPLDTLGAVDDLLAKNDRMDSAALEIVRKIVESQRKRADAKEGSELDTRFAKTINTLQNRKDRAERNRDDEDSEESRRKPMGRLARLADRALENDAAKELRDDVQREQKAVDQLISINKFAQEAKDLQKRAENGESVAVELESKQTQLSLRASEIVRSYNRDKDRVAREKEESGDKIERELNSRVESIQSWYKTFAVLIPPIPPLLVGLGVFARRRLREREGMSRARLR